jgi:adenosylhomocysteine nucleosidase
MSLPLRLPCVLFALERERLFIHDTYCITREMRGGPCRGFLCATQQQQVLVIETGVGVERALRALDWLLNEPIHDGRAHQPSLLLFAGFAGALDASLHVGDPVLADEVVDMHGNRWRSPLAAVPGVRSGRLLTTDRFIGEPADKLALGEQHAALAVDMESAAFARRCHERGVPWACLRVVSDDVSVPFTTEVAGLVEDGQVRLGRVLRLLLRKPWLLPKLLRLARQTRLAARRLADGVVQFLACSSDG